MAEKIIVENLNNPESSDYVLNLGEELDAKWGHLKLSRFNQSGDAIVVIFYEGVECSAVLSYDGYIDMAVTGGKMRIARVNSMIDNRLDITIYENPDFHPGHYVEAPDVSDIVAANGDLGDLISGMFGES